MRLKQAKTVQFGNLSEDHKAEFIHFLIKNNICFQEGKENCIAEVALKQNHPAPPTRPTHSHPAKKSAINHVLHNKTLKTSLRKSIKGTGTRPGRPLRELTLKNEASNRENMVEQKQLKTPTKQAGASRTSSLPYKQGSETLQQQKKTTPKSVMPALNRTNENGNTMVSDYQIKTRSSTKVVAEKKSNFTSSKDRPQQTLEKPRSQLGTKAYRKGETGREAHFNKYHRLFQSVDKGRAVRWPLTMLERTIEQLYDEVFAKNTQCLQTRNIDNALRTLNLSTIPQLIENYFFKKFKNHKLASTNLNNLLSSLSYHVTKTATPTFLRTFEDFLEDRLQYEDILYYLFARNVLKRELRAVQRIRQLSRAEGTYFPDAIRTKDVQRLLRGIIGRDSELLSEYKQLILTSMAGDHMEAYEFLRVLLDDFHERRVFNLEVEDEDSDQHPLFDREASYEQKNEELTFGEQHQDNSDTYHQRNKFWECLGYSKVQDNLFELVMEKMASKAFEFLQILGGGMAKGQADMERLHFMLFRKSESLAMAVFEMNKMKWFRQLSIGDPSEEDMAAVEGVQLRLKRLREAPSGRDIGEFCKSILTVYQLVSELQFSLTASDL